MAERRLRMAVPGRKWLTDIVRWSVTDISRLSGVGNYSSDNYPNFIFNPSDQDVQGVVTKPRRIPSEIASGDIDLGITGKDCVDNSIPEEINNLEEIIDLGCGYVDLAFMTDIERWKEVQKRSEEIRARLGSTNLSDLDLFLAYYGISHRPVICKSEYFRIANKHLLLKQKSLQGVQFDFSSEESRGDTESCLFCSGKDKANVIFETYATGEHAQDKNLVILEIAQSSTARLYAKSSVMNGNTDLDKWKRGKISRIRNGIKKAIKNLSNHCQIRIVFDMALAKMMAIKDLERDLDREFERAGFDAVSICYHYDMYYDLYQAKYLEALSIEDGKINDNQFISLLGHDSFMSGDYNELLLGVDRVMKKSDLIKFRKFLEERYRLGFVSKTPDNKPVRLFGAVALDLKSLYAYCPIYIMKEMNDFPKTGDYCCCDISKLRPNHYDPAFIFSIPKGQFTSNVDAFDITLYSELVSAFRIR